jgi:predicted nucleotidyltransferase component of viral defense system
MKKVSAQQGVQIGDLIAELGLGIDEFALEKDFIVTETLREICKIAHPSLDLVFCGGTCLSKAYGLLNRVSEDVDIKVVAKPGVTLSQGQRKSQMSALKKNIRVALATVGFRGEDIKETALDGNSYVVFDASYATHFAHSPAMRANLKLELNFTQLTRPALSRKMGLLFDTLALTPEPSTFSMPCVDLREALVEKLISFPRRLAMNSFNPARELDVSLVRHLYDVHTIISNDGALLADGALLQTLMLSAMEKDARDFANQHVEFLDDPVGEVNRAMQRARSDKSIGKMYESFIRVMVYDPAPPTFAAVVDSFEAALSVALPPPTLTFEHVKKAPAPTATPELAP